MGMASAHSQVRTILVHFDVGLHELGELRGEGSQGRASQELNAMACRRRELPSQCALLQQPRLHEILSQRPIGSSPVVVP